MAWRGESEGYGDAGEDTLYADAGAVDCLCGGGGADVLHLEDRSRGDYADGGTDMYVDDTVHYNTGDYYISFAVAYWVA